MNRLSIRQQTGRLTEYALSLNAAQHPHFRGIANLDPGESVSKQRVIVLETGDIDRRLLLEHYTDTGVEVLAAANPMIPPLIGTLAVRLQVNRGIITGSQPSRQQSICFDTFLTDQGAKAPFLQRETPIDADTYNRTKEELGLWGVQLQAEMPDYERVAHLDPLPDAGDIIATSLAELR